MSKKNKRSETPGEEIAEETALGEETISEIEVTAETPDEEAAAIETVAEETAADIEITADETGGTETQTPETQTPETQTPETQTPESADVSEGRIGIVSRPVNFRTGASFKNAVLAELKPGSKLALSGTVEGDKGAWYKCEFDGRTGYVKASGISVSDR